MKKGSAEAFTETLQAAAAAASGHPVQSSAITSHDRLTNEPANGLQGDAEERVAELRRRYRNGSYTVDPSAVAKKLLDDHLA